SPWRRLARDSERCFMASFTLCFHRNDWRLAASGNSLCAPALVDFPVGLIVIDAQTVPQRTELALLELLLLDGLPGEFRQCTLVSGRDLVCILTEVLNRAGNELVRSVLDVRRALGFAGKGADILRLPSAADSPSLGAQFGRILRPGGVERTTVDV